MASQQRRSRRFIILGTAVGLIAPAAVALVAAGPATAAPRPLSLRPVAGLSTNFGCNTKPAAHTVSCFGQARAQRASNGHVSPLASSAPTGYGPADLQSAYALTGRHSGGRTVAIVDANDDPSAEADLGVYRSHFGLPACTTANGCFRKVNQSGASSPLPAVDYGWAEEISLDLDMVSATCPDCHILLVEASSADDASLLAAVDTAAATPGVAAISNSYGGPEDATITGLDSHFDHPGIAITASTGDAGYGVSWPASSPDVTAVGGTSLSKTSTARGWTETAWSGAGSGCSAYEPKPSWQHDTGCAKRTVGDVSAVADPNTGVAVYDTANSCASLGALCTVLLSLGLAQGADGYVQVGGTSASSPIVASVYALAGGAPTAASSPYAHPGSLFDVTSGSNGSCGGSYLCTAGAGYDGPTGLGTPDGTGAF